MATIALEILTNFPVTPRFMIVELDEADWPKWLWGSRYDRIKMIYPYISDLYHGPATIRELVWIRLDNLNKTDKQALINLLER